MNIEVLRLAIGLAPKLGETAKVCLFIMCGALASIPSASIKKRKSCASLSKFNLISPDFVHFYFLSSCIMTKRSNPHLWKLLNFCYIE